MAAEDCTQKRCTKCGETKHKIEFSKKTSSNDGLNWHCKKCCSEYSKKHYEQNREKLVDYAAIKRRCNPEKAREIWSRSAEKNRAIRLDSERSRRNANRDSLNQKSREYKSKNRAKISDYNKRYYIANKQRENARCLKYRSENKHIFTAWRRNNVELCAKHRRDRRSRILCASGRHTISDIKNIYALQRGRCACCMKKLNKYHVDHRMPLARGGSNDRLNLQLLCPECNLSKNAKHPIDFMQERGFLL